MRTIYGVALAETRLLENTEIPILAEEPHNIMYTIDYYDSPQLTSAILLPSYEGKHSPAQSGAVAP